METRHIVLLGAEEEISRPAAYRLKAAELAKNEADESLATGRGLRFDPKVSSLACGR